jgi:hypothetical protein
MILELSKICNIQNYCQAYHVLTRKFTWTSPDRKTHNQIGQILIDRRRYSNILDVRSFRGADCDTEHCGR